MDRRKKDTKQKIINLAIHKIEKKGFLEASIREIAAEFKMSPSAVYNHFKNKDDLYNQVLVAVSKELYLKYKNEYVVDEKLTIVNQVVYFAAYLINQFILHPKTMEFILLSPNALQAFSELKSFNSKGHYILNEAYFLLGKLIDEYNLDIDINIFYIKCWSFFQGYVILITAHVVEYDEIFIRSTLEEFIGI